MNYKNCVIGLSLQEYKKLLNNYLDIIFRLEDLSDLKLYNDVSKNISKMHTDARPYRLELIHILIERGYVKLVLKMIRKLSEKDLFENEDVWFSTYLSYEIHCNFSDVSKNYSRELLKYGIADLLITNISQKSYPAGIAQNKKVTTLVKLSLSVLHHIVKYQETDMLYPFKEHDVRNNILKLVKSENESIKGLASLILAYIYDDEDQTILEEVSDSVHLLVKCLQEAMKIVDCARTRRALAFTVEELVQGAAALAINDNLKTIMDENGIIPLLIQLASGELVEEIIPAIKALWNLSFNKTICEKLINKYDMISILEKCSKIENSTILKVSNGALWKLREEKSSHLKLKKENNNQTPEKTFAFISYNWKDKETVKKIVDDLKKENINLWIDFENIKGSILEAMASGIEECTAVILFMSDNYKRSPNCRSEAEYAFKLNKPILPIIVENKYKPNGWLGIILGASLYYDFSGNRDYGITINSMVHNLKEALNPKIVESSVLIKPLSVSQWTEMNIKKWLIKNDMAHLQSTLGKLNGHLLIQLSKIRREAPDYFYTSLEKKWNLDFIDILRLTYALEHL